MNTSKQVNVMIGLLMVFLVGTFLYFVWDRARADDALERQVLENAERGADLYAANCRVCHGVTGMGTLENPNLPGAPLNLEANRPEEVGRLQELQNRFRDTIVCGRVGTLMPPWSTEQGGSLNDFQIQQLVALITGAMPELDLPEDNNAVSELAWERAVEHADELDILEGKLLAEAVDASATVFVLTDAQELTIGGLLRLDDEVVRVVDAPASSSLKERIDGSQTEIVIARADVLFQEDDIIQIGDERLRIVGIDGETVQVERGVEGTKAEPHSAEIQVFEPKNTIEVERGAFDTEAAPHDEGTQVYLGPLEPPEGPVIGADGVPPCGQLPAAPTGGGGAQPIPIEGNEVTLNMGDHFFELDGQQAPTLQVSVGQEVTVNLTNSGAAIHNMHLAGLDGEYADAFCQVGGEEPCSDPAQIAAGGTGTLTFSFDQAGTVPFRCDFHPRQMIGEIVVVE